MDILSVRWLGLVTLCASAACVPDLDTDESTITGPRVLAVQAEPAEASPAQNVRYRALVVDEDGTRTDGELTWYYCDAPKPLAELGPVNEACLRGSEGHLDKIGEGLEVQGMLPQQSCALFGPNPPPPMPDGQPGRPADPDQTGGYGLPVMLGVDLGEGTDVALYEQRIACGLSGVNAQQTLAFAQRYKRNRNPELSKLAVTRDDGDQEQLEADGVLEVKQGEELTFSARWPSCPEQDECGDALCGPDETLSECPEDCTTPSTCAGQERYVYFDPNERELIVRRESLRLAWYATGGAWTEERTGVDEEAAKSSENVWTAPDESGALTLWIVLRDARGGVGFREQRVSVQ